ncbi:hypothetical protein GCM10022223_44240 [Kineosporia mesophila]|uniref:NADH dehydrogenase subunit 6 n=1 Tax=Kineosporia mesophila TaxID=566012 RepID=A0ABP6ZZD4_9ACTN|nr:hypothetical protein [Kineosporia mesophila]MCD5348848.1 hypothetical protein [Kineosporia mesophila]
MSNLFLVCLLLGGVACVMWREFLYLLMVLGVAMFCMAFIFIALGVQSVAQAS